MTNESNCIHTNDTTTPATMEERSCNKELFTGSWKAEDKNCMQTPLLYFSQEYGLEILKLLSRYTKVKQMSKYIAGKESQVSPCRERS